MPTAASLVVLVGGDDVAADLAVVEHPVLWETARVTPRSFEPCEGSALEHVADDVVDAAVWSGTAPAALTAAPVSNAVAEAARAATSRPLLRIR
ncbi:MAG TPA: hypothetical protein VGN48_15280 [Pedococcus sp.]|nr:hypothetical protein [Pedococcus sp.]